MTKVMLLDAILSRYPHFCGNSFR